ncbi:uncharacterized protein LOC113385103 [Ctenocephalides felis]|uniref:uncharacterized protein LOC113385103 n=1 Tax=Ctenocephalides felis TaxID=7515 RepID=UPI000E6E5714|nr:uncharacterized protein LOC113385103 [Ctenocephalides felis]
MKPINYLCLILPIITFASIVEGRSYPESVSPLHRRLARNEVYAVNALTYDDIPDGLRSEFSDDDVNDTVEEVQRLLAEDPSLPRLTRTEILALFDNVTRAEKVEKQVVPTTKIDLVPTTAIPTFENLDKRGTVHKKLDKLTEYPKNDDSDEKIILETFGIVDRNIKKTNKKVNEANTRVVLLDENKNNDNISHDEVTSIPETTDNKGVYVVLPDSTKPTEQSTSAYVQNSNDFESYESHNEELNPVNSNSNNYNIPQESDDYITEFTDITKNNVKQTTPKPQEVPTTNKDDQFHIDIEKLSDLTSSSFEDKKTRDELNVNVNLGIRGVMKNQDQVRIIAPASGRGSIRYYDAGPDTRHSNHKYSDEDKFEDSTTIRNAPVYVTSTVKSKPQIESTGRPFSVPTINPDNYVRFKPVLYKSSPPTSKKTIVEHVEEIITVTPQPITELPKTSFTTQSFEKLIVASVRPETYAKFRPLPKVDLNLSKDMQSFLSDFGLLPKSPLSQNRVNRKLISTTTTTTTTTTAPRKPTNKNVFSPANTTRISLEKLTQLLEAVKQLENINTTLTNEDLDSIADKLEALGIGSRDRSKLSSGPNPLSDRYNVDWNKNEIKRQQPNSTEEIFKVDLLSNNKSGDQLSEQSESEPKVVNSTPTTTTTTTTTAKPDLLALEESFGAPIDPSTIDEELPPPRKNGLYFLADWNSFLEVGEDGKDKVVIRFDPKVGDPSRFIPVTVP